MIAKIVIAAIVIAAINLAVADGAAPAKAVQDARCAQAQGYGIDDLRRAGLTINCN